MSSTNGFMQSNSFKLQKNAPFIMTSSNNSPNKGDKLSSKDYEV